MNSTREGWAIIWFMFGLWLAWGGFMFWIGHIA